MPIKPTPTPPGEISPSIMCAIGASAAERRERVVHAVDRAGRRAGRRAGPDAAGGSAEAHLLALHVPARLRRRDRLVDTDSAVSFGLPFCLGEHREAGEHAPGSPPSPRAAAGSGVCRRPVLPNVTTNANGISRSAKISSMSVKPVGFSNGCAELVLYGPPPLRAELLDRLLRGERPAGDRAASVISVDLIDGGRDGVAVQVLDHALRQQHDGEHQRQRQQDAHDRAGQVDPEVAEVAGAGAGDAADQRDRRSPCRRRPTRSSAPSGRSSG